ncbi:MAG: hypothetical protein M3536_00270 [Actinomycetota bacterium]|nr:hypothetical protein [Actinomycetota bacterium]
MSLPACSVEYPSCGACGDNTSHDGDTFYCEDCDLDYGNGNDGNEATFRDEEEKTCGKPCDNTWHAPEQLNLICTPCKLPATHRSFCWTDCKGKQ